MLGNRYAASLSNIERKVTEAFINAGRSYVERAHVGWGGRAFDFIQALALRCDMYGLFHVARRLQIDADVLTAAIDHRYKGDHLVIERAVKTVYQRFSGLMPLAMGTANADKAHAAWYGAPPDWVLALAEACDEEGDQRYIAQRLQYSASVVSQVLGNKYRGDMRAVQMRVRGVLLGHMQQCPFFREIRMNFCLEHQRRRRDRIRDNVQRQLYGCCARCPNNLRHLPKDQVSQEVSDGDA